MQVEEQEEALEVILVLIAATCINFTLTIVTQVDIYTRCICFSFEKDGARPGRHYHLLDSTHKSEGRRFNWHLPFK